MMLTKNSIRILQPKEWQSIYSPYIKSGYKDDNFDLSWLGYNEKEVMATCKMTNYYVSSTDDNGFHLSIFTAIALLGQPCIIHAHVINNNWKKNFEVLLGKFSIDMVRPIRTPEEISLKLWIINKIHKPSKSQKSLLRAAYTYAFDIEEGSFIGELKAYFSFMADDISLPV